jgi:pyridoxamine 5'-phosphate oxidase family protein
MERRGTVFDRSLRNFFGEEPDVTERTDLSPGESTFTAAERAYLGNAPLGRLATTSAKHVPDVAPVTFRLEGDELVVTGMDITKTRKYFNVRATQAASIVVDDLETVSPWRPRGVKVTGSARFEGDGDSDGRTTRIVITPQTIWSWGINEGAATTFGPIEKRNA